MKRIVTLIMMRTLTGHSLITHQKAAMIPYMKGVRSGSHCYLMQPTYSFWFIGNKFSFGYITGYCHYCCCITYQFDSDSYEILIDNCCSHSLTNSKEDFIEPPVKSKVRVRGYNGHTNSAMVGTVKWRVKDDNGKAHSIILPNTYYSPSVETRLLSSQHWAQVSGRKRDTYCITYYDAIIMRWNRDKYQITAPLDDRKHRNVGVMRSISGIKNYLTSCQAFEEINETLAFLATINLDKETEPAVVSDDETSIQDQVSDETSVQEQVIVNQEPPSSDQIEEQEGVGQMMEEPKEIIFEDDPKVDEEESVYADDK